MIPGFVSIYIDKENYKHLYFYPGIDENNEYIYHNIDWSDYSFKIDETRNEDGSIDYKFYDKSIVRITCKLIDNKDKQRIEVLNFK